MQRFEEILCFWFGGLEEKDFAEPRKSWFAAEPDVDAEIRRLFLDDYNRAARGEFHSWRDTAQSCLALTIVLDQFPRNMFRNDPRAYASDDTALATAEYAVRTGFDREFPPVARAFFYLPFEHSENLEHQQRSVESTSALPYDSHRGVHRACEGAQGDYRALRPLSPSQRDPRPRIDAGGTGISTPRPPAISQPETRQNATYLRSECRIEMRRASWRCVGSSAAP